jgi:hypothetical protein
MYNIKSHYSHLNGTEIIWLEFSMNRLGSIVVEYINIYITHTILSLSENIDLHLLHLCSVIFRMYEVTKTIFEVIISPKECPHEVK